MDKMETRRWQIVREKKLNAMAREIADNPNKQRSEMVVLSSIIAKQNKWEEANN